MRWLVVAVLAAGCGGDKQPAPAPADPPHAPADAGVTARTPTVTLDPGNGAHLDDDVARRPSSNNPARQGKPIDITLRSTPSGAAAFVDGTPVGPTPTYWSGVADGRPHEFTFTLSGYDIARYRFVPITSGVIHARMSPVSEDVDAGVPEIVVPPADAPVAPLAPPTVIAPAPDAPPAPAPPVGPQP
jgi:PEGA domain-containing protein